MYTRQLDSARDRNAYHVYWWIREAVSLLETLESCADMGQYPGRGECFEWIHSLAKPIEFMSYDSGIEVVDPDGIARHLPELEDHLLSVQDSADDEQSDDDWEALHNAIDSLRSFLSPIGSDVLKEAILDSSL